MEANAYALCMIAALCAGAAASQALSVFEDRRPARRRRSGSAVRIVRNGVGAFVPLARCAMRAGAVRRFAEGMAAVLAERGIATGPVQVTSIVCGLCVVAAGGALVLTGSLAASLAAMLCAVALTAFWSGHQTQKMRQQARDAAPDAIASLAACFHAGLSLMQAFERVSQEVPGSLGSSFAQGAHVLQTGGTASEALACLREGDAVREMSFVAVALDVQHQAGGSMGEILESARQSLESEMELSRTLRVKTAQAKLSARVVSVMPFVLVCALSLISEGFLDPFFESAAGLVMLGFALAMEAAGVIAVNRMLRVGE